MQTHRDPLRIIASLSSLMSVLRRLGSDDISIPDIAGEFADYLAEGLDRSVAARVDGTVPADRVVDVQFRAFMADPFATIHEIYDRLGLELDADAEQRMRDFLADNTTEKHGGHHYTWTDTGLDLERVARAHTRLPGVLRRPVRRPRLKPARPRGRYTCAITLPE